MSFAVLGAMQLKNGICYTYAFELVELKNKPMVCSAINIWDVSTLMWINLYILHVSRNWWYIMAAYTTLGCIAWTILVMFGHESPKWMMMDGRSNDCKEELQKIIARRLHKSPPSKSTLCVDSKCQNGCEVKVYVFSGDTVLPF